MNCLFYPKVVCIFVKTITMKKIAFLFTLIFLFAASISLIINLLMKQWEPSLWIFISIVWAANTALYQYMDIYNNKDNNTKTIL